jgi:hypothetical protein
VATEENRAGVVGAAQDHLLGDRRGFRRGESRDDDFV